MNIFINPPINTLLKKYVVLGMMVIVIPTVSFAKAWSLQALQISLPDQFQQIAKQESHGVDYYWYGDRNNHIKIVRLHKTPSQQAQWTAWQTDMLGKQIALWRETSGQSLENQQQVFGQKPQTETIGKFTYQTAEMAFPTEKVKFLNTINGEFTYMFTLSSTEPNLTLRDNNLKQLLESLDSFVPKTDQPKSIVKPNSNHSP